MVVGRGRGWRGGKQKLLQGKLASGFGEHFDNQRTVWITASKDFTIGALPDSVAHLIVGRVVPCDVGIWMPRSP